jgi:hypothetical protein
MVGLHPGCCCEDQDTCPSGTCCEAGGVYNGEGCPDTYNVNITVTSMTWSCADGACDDWVIPAMDEDFEIPTPCGNCPGIPFGTWCGGGTRYHCDGTYEDPCVPKPECHCPADSPHGYGAPGPIQDQKIDFWYRAGSAIWVPIDGRVRMEFLIEISYGYGGPMTWYLRMDKPAPNCIDWTVDDAGIFMMLCNNCTEAMHTEPFECTYCNTADPSQPNYFGCCYQCAGYDCCDALGGCNIENGMIMPNNWGRASPGDYPRTWSTPAILGFTIS